MGILYVAKHLFSILVPLKFSLNLYGRPPFLTAIICGLVKYRLP